LREHHRSGRVAGAARGRHLLGVGALAMCDRGGCGARKISRSARGRLRPPYGRAGGAESDEQYEDEEQACEAERPTLHQFRRL
jgi:hypothetical protein